MAITIPGSRRPSIGCLVLIQRFEQCVLRAYMPTPDDVPTIGWGSTGPDVKLGTVWTQKQADQRFAVDVERFARGVDRLLDGAATTQDQFDALVSFAYNVGIGALEKSTLLKMHRAENYTKATSEFSRWNKQKRKVLRGLTRRRAVEADLYSGIAV